MEENRAIEVRAEIVPSTPIVVNQPKLRVAGHTFIPVVIGSAKGNLIKFSQREVQFLSRFLETMNLQEACDEIGIEKTTGQNYLKRPHVRKYVEERLRMAALEAGTDIRNQMAWLREVRDGENAPSATQLEAAKIISRHLRPAGGGIQVNTQVNVNAGAGASRYSSMTTEELETELKERLGDIKQ